ncbi:CHAT domain-containing protein [Dactylosporangium sp. NPDC049140]|uniref:CHAT domain-containing protein n=1 Tax=Dactylosporangium sp. NPDC049140 TaxID=3155647 RepID=UPI0033F07153
MTINPEHVQVHRRIADALAGLVRAGGDSAPHPYLRRYLADHAARGLVLDAAHVPPEFLRWDTSRRIGHLLSQAVPAERARDHLTAWAHVEASLPPDAGAAARMASLEFAGQASGVAIGPQGSWLHTDWADWRFALYQDGFDTLIALPGPGQRTRLATTDRPAGIRLYESDTGRAESIGELRPSALAALPADQGRTLIAVATGRLVQLVDPDSGRAAGEALNLQSGVVQALAAVPTDAGSMLAAADRRGSIHLVHPAAGAPAATLTGHAGPIFALAVVPVADGPALLASAGYGGEIRLWNPLGVRQVAVLQGHADSVRALAVVPVGHGRNWLASAGDGGEIRLWDPAAGAPAGPPLTGHAHAVHALATLVHPGRATLLLSADDAGEVRVWDPVGGAAVASCTTGMPARALAALPGAGGDGRFALAGTGGVAVLRVPAELTAPADNPPAATRSAETPVVPRTVRTLSPRPEEHTILISEEARDPGGAFTIQINFGGGEAIRATLTDPGHADTEELLRWYFEDHIRYPYLDHDRRARAAAEIRHYGEALFAQLFGGAAAPAYRRARERGFDGYRLVVAGSPQFQRLHWEALRDRAANLLVALRMPVLRRPKDIGPGFELPAEQSVLRILVLVARPDGRADVGYRTISRPLLDAVRQARIPVVVDLVGVGTWAALRDHLRDASRRHGTGHYQVVHFDMHGAFVADDTRRARPAGHPGEPTNRNAFPVAVTGPDPLPPGGYLFFETGTDGEADPVPAARVAAVLAEHRVGVAVLNACQSAVGEDDEVGLAQELVAAGAPVAVGMAYTVTVSAAARAMPEFYRQLAGGADPAAAAWAMRQVLHDNKTRQAYFDYTLDLEDWLLPVVFERRPVRLGLRPMSDRERDDFYARQAGAGAEPPVKYGFVGRDLDIHAIERLMLLDGDVRQAVVVGPTGIGRTALLAHATWWWRRTGLARQTVRMSSDRTGADGDLLDDIARVLLGPDAPRRDARPPAARDAQVAAQLRADPFLIVIDDADLLPGADRARLAGLLGLLRGGRTMVLMSARRRDEWPACLLPDHVHELDGLDPPAASSLLERIVRSGFRSGSVREHADERRGAELSDLLTVLAGHPLAMRVALPRLSVESPATLLAKLGGIDGRRFEEGRRFEVVWRAIDISHNHVEPRRRRAALLLAPFADWILFHTLTDYAAEFADEDLAMFGGDLVEAGLATPHPDNSAYLRLAPALVFFLRAALQDEPELRARAEAAHYHLYTRVGQALEQLLADVEPPRRVAAWALTEIELGNLHTALDYALNAGRPVLPVLGPIDAFLEQTGQGDARWSLLLRVIADHAHTTGDDQRRELIQVRRRARELALGRHAFDEVEIHGQAELALAAELGDRSAEAAALIGLGQAEERRGNLLRAARYYQLAAEIEDEPETHLRLGVTQLRAGDLGQAEAQFRLALVTGSAPTVAAARYQLGVAAQAGRRFAEAESDLTEALDLFRRLDDLDGLATVHQQLGLLLQETHRYTEAASHHQAALRHTLALGDQYRSARAFEQLANTAAAAGRPDEAERYYRRAADIMAALGDQYEKGRIGRRLAGLLVEAGRVREAMAIELSTAVAERMTTGQWGDANVAALRQLFGMVTDAQLLSLVEREVPDELRAELISELRLAV